MEKISINDMGNYGRESGQTFRRLLIAIYQASTGEKVMYITTKSHLVAWYMNKATNIARSYLSKDDVKVECARTASRFAARATSSSLPSFETKTLTCCAAYRESESKMTDASDSPLDKQIPEPQDLRIENALLRSSLWLAARTLKDYQDAPHFEIDDDGRPMVEVIVPESLRTRAADALARAEKMLKDEGRGR